VGRIIVNKILGEAVTVPTNIRPSSVRPSAPPVPPRPSRETIEKLKGIRHGPAPEPQPRILPSQLSEFKPIEEEFFKNIIRTYQANFIVSNSYEQDLSAATKNIIEFLERVYDEIGGPFKVDIGYDVELFGPKDDEIEYTFRSKFFLIPSKA
jgi:hypothetical protein